MRLLCRNLQATKWYSVYVDERVLVVSQKLPTDRMEIAPSTKMEVPNIYFYGNMKPWACSPLASSSVNGSQPAS
jgi:hypothetical protein